MNPFEPLVVGYLTESSQNPIFHKTTFENVPESVGEGAGGSLSDYMEITEEGGGGVDGGYYALITVFLDTAWADGVITDSATVAMHAEFFGDPHGEFGDGIDGISLTAATASGGSQSTGFRTGAYDDGNPPAESLLGTVFVEADGTVTIF